MRTRLIELVNIDPTKGNAEMTPTHQSTGRQKAQFFDVRLFQTLGHLKKEKN